MPTRRLIQACESRVLAVLFGPFTVCEVHRIRTEGAFSVVELRPSISAGANKNLMELQADERLADMLRLIRKDTLGSVSLSEKAISRLDAGVIDMGGLSVDSTPQMDNVIGRAQANHTTAALMAQAMALLADHARTEAEEIIAHSAEATDSIELQALKTRREIFAACVETNAAMLAEQQVKAQKDIRGVHGLRQESATDRLKRQERTQARFRLVKRATQVISLTGGGPHKELETAAAERLEAAKQNRFKDARAGFP